MHAPGPILSTLFTEDPPMSFWDERVDTVRLQGRLLGDLGQILRRAPGYGTLVLDGSGRRDQIAAPLLRMRHPRARLVIADSTWKRHDSALRDAADRLAIRLIDGPRTTFCVHSRYEVETFPRTWGPLRGRAWFTPWACTLKQDDLGGLTSDNGRVFAGGDSLRDYGPLIAAAARIPAPVDIATTTLPPPADGPANLTVASLSPTDYEARLFAASVVVVPLRARPDRSSGQTTYINAMALGKALVVTDTPGVRDYVRDGETGLLVAPGDVDGLTDAVRRLIDDPGLRRTLGQRARVHALGELTLGNYARAILAAVDVPDGLH